MLTFSHSRRYFHPSVPIHPPIHRPNKVFLFKVMSHYSSHPGLKTRTDGRTGRGGREGGRERAGLLLLLRDAGIIKLVSHSPYPFPPPSVHPSPFSARSGTAHAAATAARANLATSAYRTVCATRLFFPSCLFVCSFNLSPAALNFITFFCV